MDLKRVVGIVSIIYFVYLIYIQGTVNIMSFLTITGILNFAFLAGGASLLFGLPKIVGIVSGIALLVRSYMYSTLILSVAILFDPFSLVSLIVLPLGILYFSIVDAY